MECAQVSDLALFLKIGVKLKNFKKETLIALPVHSNLVQNPKTFEVPKTNFCLWDEKDSNMKIIGIEI